TPVCPRSGAAPSHTRETTEVGRAGSILQASPGAGHWACPSQVETEAVTEPQAGSTWSQSAGSRQVQWGTPVIPGAWEAEAGGSRVGGQPQPLRP
uniref:Uncharacterized protein n=1 Tax=Marmota marmota marmota TaxID=9994 RepID=A0A8C6ET22_MARMA